MAQALLCVTYYAGETVSFFNETGMVLSNKVKIMKKLFVHILCELPVIQIFGWSLLSGVIGILILAGFFSTIMSLELLSMLLPVVVAANASISGYMLIDRAGDELVHTHIVTVAVGIGVALLSFIAVNAICIQIGGFILMSANQALIAIGLAVLGAWSAGILAIKYRQLKEQAAGS
jgi:hypothetical protein